MTTFASHTPASIAPDTSKLTDQPIRVVVADDHPLYRDGIIRALRVHGGFAVVGEASNGVDALELIRELHPDVALLDVRMPRMDGIEVVHALALHGPDVPAVLLSAFSGAHLVDAGLAAGAATFINKTAEREAICAKVASVAKTRRAPRTLASAERPHTHGPRGHRA